MQATLDPTTGIAQDLERQDRLEGPPFDEGERDEQGGGERQRPEHVLARPSVLASTPDEPHQQRRRTAREQASTEPVES